MRLVCIFVSVAVVACLSPPLAVEDGEGFVVLDFQVLGEYPSEIRRLQLLEQSTQQVIWELEAAEGSPQIWRLRLSLGENASDINELVVGGRLHVKSPDGKQIFVLSAGTTYQLRVWGEGARSARARFAVD